MSWVLRAVQCQLQGSWRDKEKLWIVMEYCGGGSVSDLIQANGNAPLDEEVIAYICKETLAGLAYLHSIGKVGRRLWAEGWTKSSQ